MNMRACEVVIAQFVYGSQTCGVTATKKIEGGEGEVYICDEHFIQLATAEIIREAADTLRRLEF